MAFKTDRLSQRLAGIALSRAVIERLCLVQSPVAHCTLRVHANALFKSPRRLVIPEIVQQIQSLVEPHLRFWRRRDLHVNIADASHLSRHGQFPREMSHSAFPSPCWTYSFVPVR